MFYSAKWVLRIPSTRGVIVLEMAELWLLHLHTLLVCMVRKVVLKSHPKECQHTITYTTYRTHSKLNKFSYKYGGLNKGN